MERRHHLHFNPRRGRRGGGCTLDLLSASRSKQFASGEDAVQCRSPRRQTPFQALEIGQVPLLDRKTSTSKCSPRGPGIHKKSTEGKEEEERGEAAQKHGSDRVEGEEGEEGAGKWGRGQASLDGPNIGRDGEDEPLRQGGKHAERNEAEYMYRAGAIFAMEMVSGVHGHALKPIGSDHDGTRS